MPNVDYDVPSEKLEVDTEEQIQKGDDNALLIMNSYTCNIYICS